MVVLIVLGGMDGEGRCGGQEMAQWIFVHNQLFSFQLVEIFVRPFEIYCCHSFIYVMICMSVQSLFALLIP